MRWHYCHEQLSSHLLEDGFLLNNLNEIFLQFILFRTKIPLSGLHGVYVLLQGHQLTLQEVELLQPLLVLSPVFRKYFFSLQLYSRLHDALQSLNFPGEWTRENNGWIFIACCEETVRSWLDFTCPSPPVLPPSLFWWQCHALPSVFPAASTETPWQTDASSLKSGPSSAAPTFPLRGGEKCTGSKEIIDACWVIQVRKSKKLILKLSLWLIVKQYC